MSQDESSASPTAARDASISQIDRSLVRGIAWTGGVKWLVQVLSWASTLVVLRLVTPEDYGIVGSAALYLGFLSLVADIGISAAVVTLRDLSVGQLRQLHAAATIAGALAMLLGLAAAIPFGWFFRSDAVPPVVAVLSVTLLVSGVRSVPSALLQRQMRYRDLAAIEGIQAVVGAIATIGLALAGFGYWALCFGTVLQSAVYSLFMVRAERVGFARPDLAALQAPLQLSRRYIVGQISWWTYSNADFAIASRRLGQATFGAYLLAWEFASLPVEKITNIVTRVTPGVFSALQKDLPALRRKLLLLTEGIITLTLPASIGLALVAPEFIRVAFGEAWLEATMPLRLLCLYVSFRSVVTMLPQILLAIGESKLISRMGVAFVLVMPSAFWVGSGWGTVGIAVAWLVAYPLLTVPYFRTIFRRLELPLTDYLRAWRPAVLGTAAMVVPIVGLGALVSSERSPVVALVTKVAVGAVAYGAVALWPQRERLRGLYQTMRGA